MNQQYFIGLGIGTEYFLQQSLWAAVIPTPEEELDDICRDLIAWLRDIHEEAQVPANIGTNLHVASAMHGLLSNDWFREPYVEAFTGLTHPFSKVAHIPFADKELPPNPAFAPLLVRQLELSHLTGDSAIVIHAPKTKEDTTNEFIDELARDEVRTALRNHPVVLAVENTQDAGCHFQQLRHLLSFREKLLAQYEELGDDNFEHLIQFCFDTGHYLLFQQRDGGDLNDWKQYGPEFLAHSIVYHIHANDGTSDQHLLPFTHYPIPEKKEPFDPVAFQKNSETVVSWLAEGDRHWAIPEKHLTLEIDPYFYRREIVDFWSRWWVALHNSD